MQRILIIDDDEHIGDLEQEVLERAGYAVQRAYSGTEALLLLRDGRPDLVLLDLMLPGLSGEEVLPRLQGIPVIVVSARVTVQDKVSLLMGGAADYLTKTFDVQELLARVAVRLRECAAPLAASHTCGDLTLDEASHAVCAGGVPVALTRTEYAILKLLMRNSGQVHRQIGAAGAHQRGHAGLHRELAEDAYQPPARQAARRFRTGICRGGVGHRLSPELRSGMISTVSQRLS